jgi:flagellar hook protein FlgE
MKANHPFSWIRFLLVLTTGCRSQTAANQPATCPSGNPDACGIAEQGDAGRQVQEVDEVDEVDEVSDAGGGSAGVDVQQLGKGTVQFRLGEGRPLAVSVSLPGPGLVVIVVRNSNGNSIRTVSLTKSSTAPNDPVTYAWDGRDDSGQPAPTGIYTASVSASDANPLGVDCAFMPAVATGSITLRGNLDSTAPPLVFDSANARTTSNFNTSMTVYSSLGNAIPLDIYFSKNDVANTQSEDGSDWLYVVQTLGGNLERDGSGNAAATDAPTDVASGELRFALSGVLISNIIATEGFYPKDAVQPQVVTFNFGSGINGAGSGVDGITQFGTNSAVTCVSQDGTGSFIACVGANATLDAGQRDPSMPDASPAPLAATESITIRGNLDYASRPTTFDPDLVQATSNFSTAMMGHDQLGRAMKVEIYFCKNDRSSTQVGDSGDWTYHVVTAAEYLATVNDGVNPGWSTRPVEIGTGRLSFDTMGRLISNSASLTTSFVTHGATNPQLITFNFGTSTNSGGTGLDGLTQYAATSAITFISEQTSTGE